MMGLVLTGLLAGCGPEQQETESLGEAGLCAPLGHECIVRSDTRLIGIELPSEVQPLTRFPVKVRVEGLEPGSVVVQFDMKSMDMGVNRFGLRQKGAVWEGEAILPVCTSGRTDWLATVEATTQAGTIQAEFSFETSR
jgi:hypothetical protein